MREIKFRAWYPKGGSKTAEWGYTYTYWFLGSGRDNSVFFQTALAVEQSTGLMDFSGREIFEGDVIQYMDTTQKPFRRVVVFEKGGFGYRDLVSTWVYLGKRNDEFQIIGNIHENPELLK